MASVRALAFVPVRGWPSQPAYALHLEEGDRRRAKAHAPWHDQHWREPALESERYFGSLHEATFQHEHVLDADGVIARFAGVSHVAVLSSGEQDAVFDEVRSVLATHPSIADRSEFAIPYRVDTSWCERTA